MPIQSTINEGLTSHLTDHKCVKSMILSLISGSVHSLFRLPQCFFLSGYALLKALKEPHFSPVSFALISLFVRLSGFLGD